MVARRDGSDVGQHKTVFALAFSIAFVGGVIAAVVGGIVFDSFLWGIATGLAWCGLAMALAGVVLFLDALRQRHGSRE